MREITKYFIVKLNFLIQNNCTIISHTTYNLGFFHLVLTFLFMDVSIYFYVFLIHSLLWIRPHFNLVSEKYIFRKKQDNVIHQTVNYKNTISSLLNPMLFSQHYCKQNIL